MSKLIVYILDRIVWLLLFTVITAQSLQIVGLMDPPKALEQITYPEENQYDYQLAVVNNEARGKRQTDATEQRSQLIDSLFNIPISTLNALNNLVQHSRPAIRKLREYAVQRFTGTTTPSSAAQKKVFPVFNKHKGEQSQNTSNS
ncbi:uncharacterized protein LOC123309079 isoform X1 [Coccinella septempunctata]|uniref:uncharacterized protein LOC123309079 isoform X1 n=1 Tax=Coccinella septempunctata TaxID=41139 RepID=UPI001D084AC2|nr:uncharacterized protein LOC123309079 isoform X1 [Coccinella septempunctata]